MDKYNCVWCLNAEYHFYFISVLFFKQMITDVECCVIKFRQYTNILLKHTQKWIFYDFGSLGVGL